MTSPFSGDSIILTLDLAYRFLRSTLVHKTVDVPWHSGEGIGVTICFSRPVELEVDKFSHPAVSSGIEVG